MRIPAPRAVVVALILACVSAPSRANAACSISGPASVDVSESFTLCGPSGTDVDYEWSGAGVSSGTQCMNVRGLSAGSYEFRLVLRHRDGRIERCTREVVVGAAAGGSLRCAISGPSSIGVGQSAQLCAPSSSLHAFEWSGPGGFSSTARCITVGAEGPYTLVIRNVVTGYTRECSHQLDVAGVAGRVECAIEGPTAVQPGATVELCGPLGNYDYRWSAPHGAATGRCIEADRAGDYVLTVRDPATGLTRRCSTRLDEGGSNECLISGPTEVEPGTTARLCGPTLSDTDYSWTGPGGFRATTRCITVRSAGSYRLTMRSRTSGYTVACTRELATGSADDADQAFHDNCPHTLGWWLQQVAGGSELDATELRRIATRADALSSRFNWTNDLAGLTAALRPARPVTQRKHAERQLAVLLANVAAADVGVVAVGLDADTRIESGNVETVRDLIATADRQLQSGRGSFARLSQALSRVNAGRGIGPVCE